MRRSFLSLIAIIVLSSGSAEAHKPSDSYLSFAVLENAIEGQWDIALRDLDYAIGLDRNDDGAITWGELQARHDAVSAYALSRLKIEADGVACTTHPTTQLVDHHSDGAYGILRFAVDCRHPVKSLTIDYNLFFDLDPQHRGLLRVASRGATHTAIMSPEREVWRLALGRIDWWHQFLDYARDGVWHIWIGFDHILFLFTLLLPTVLRRQDGRWHAVQSFRRVFLDVFRIVTAFTVAHSITLSLAALGVISLPSRLVESAIAASVVIAALNNLYPIVTRRIWLVAFGFGLVHGLGFANVLKDLSLPQDSLVLSLFGFNLGVEVGQLAIVAACLPLIYVLRRWRLYPGLALRVGSAAIATLALFWFVERAFNIETLLL